jgi:hypothetical protein
VRHLATRRFWYCYRQLPEEVQQLADRCYTLLRTNPRHPSLHFKKVGRYLSARVGLHYRALAVEHEQNAIWFWIGTHAEYDQIIYRA